MSTPSSCKPRRRARCCRYLRGVGGRGPANSAHPTLRSLRDREGAGGGPSPRLRWDARMGAARHSRGRARAKRGHSRVRPRNADRCSPPKRCAARSLPTEPYYPDALTCLGEAELALHQTKSAIAHLERSVSLTTRYLPNELPKARFALAKALRVAGREPKRARELAESARKDLSRAQGSESDVAEVDEWLGRGGR